MYIGNDRTSWDTTDTSLRAEVELCVQRRTALEQIGEGVPDWEDENIEQAPDVLEYLGGAAWTRMFFWFFLNHQNPKDWATPLGGWEGSTPVGTCWTVLNEVDRCAVGRSYNSKGWYFPDHHISSPSTWIWEAFPSLSQSASGNAVWDLRNEEGERPVLLREDEEISARSAR